MTSKLEELKAAYAAADDRKAAAFAAAADAYAAELKRLQGDK